MKKMIKNILFSSVILFPFHAFADGGVAAIMLSQQLSQQNPPPPKPVIQVPPAPLGSEWLIITNVQYKNGMIRNCETRMFQKIECSKWFTPQELIDLKIGRNNTAIGIGPFLSYEGEVRGVVIYYKQTESK